MSEAKLSAYIDGGSRGNPGEAGIGVYFPGVVRIAEYLGVGTNNYAEYSALLTALRFAVFTRYPSLAPPNGVPGVLPAVPDLTASQFPSTLPLPEFFTLASEKRVTQRHCRMLGWPR